MSMEYQFPLELEFLGFEFDIRSMSYLGVRRYCHLHFRPKLERFTYRYRSVSADDLSRDRLRDILVRSRFWLSKAADFNDPFDSQSYQYIDGNILRRRERLQRLVRAQEPNMNWKAREKLVKKMAAGGSAVLTNALEQAHRRMLDTTGLVCFSDDPRNILTWAHYADSHRGICLQFEPARDLRTFARALPMEYGEDYPEQNWIEDSTRAETDGLYGKFSAWGYEQERRIVAPGGAHRWLKFKPEALTGLVFGCASTQFQRDVVMALIEERGAANGPPLHLYKAVRDRRQYRLHIQKV